MKVKVIDVNGARDLAIGKVYEVVRQKENGNFVIVNEAGREVSFKASRFEIVPEVTTFKVGDVLKGEEVDEKYILIHEEGSNLVALLSLSSGEISQGFHVVADINAITKEEMEVIDGDFSEYPLVKVN